MCGIAGIVTWDGPDIDPPGIDGMVCALRHRGPDGVGSLVRGRVALGHARLAVIDPAGGAQPMDTRDGRVSITYNGELYNFRELKRELESGGYRFRTSCDTEVVLAAWLQWGPASVERFRGMFAFGLVDRARRQLFLARDHVGIKPLVYYRMDREFCFASELGALKARDSFPSELEPRALDDYLALSYIPAPRTAYRGVYKLPPAHHLTVDLDTGRMTEPKRFWHVRFEPQTGRSVEDWTRELEHTIRESVRAHLVSDVPVGALLSGGVDSSLVVSLMTQEAAAPVRTFSIGFEEEAFDETAFAKTASEQFGTQHHQRTVRADALEILPELVAHYGEPFGDWSAVPTYYLSQLAREHVPVVLSGDGGDEGFAGYPRYERALSSRVRRLGAKTPRPGDEADWARTAMMVLRAPARRALWRPEFESSVRAPVEALQRVSLETEAWDAVSRAQWTDVVTYLPGAILTKVDVASMMHGLEVRTPLADRRVIDFAATVPSDYLLRPTLPGRFEGKHLIKQILRQLFSEDFVARPKKGFVPPVTSWFEASRPGGAEVRDRLLRKEARIYEYLRPNAVQSLIDELGQGGAAEPVWLLLFLETWLASAEGSTQ